MRRRIFALGLLCCSSAACSLLSAPPDSTRFVILASVDELSGGVPAAAAVSSLRVGLGPIACPEYLRGRELVTREDGTRIAHAPNERWAEPFENSLERVLAVDFQRELGIGQLTLHPWYETAQPDVQIEIAFARCELEPGGKAVVACHWIVRRLGPDGAELSRDAHVERSVTGTDGAASARALSECLAELTRTIAGAVREMTPR
ncbi:MAG TPA: PqiC family protein [Planctomycetota bacterium]|nr:PqiC family protein [Planctomycetota bacterium]